MPSRRLQETSLRYFLEVARTGSLTEAAARLNVSISAISRQVAALETLVGAPLFERRPRRWAPCRAAGARTAVRPPAFRARPPGG